MSAVPLDEVKQHLQMSLDKTTNDVELQRFINSAETAISHRVGPLAPTSVVEKRDGGTTSLLLCRRHVVSLTGIAYADGSSASLGDFDLDTDVAQVFWNYGTAGRFPTGRRNVIVTYLAGFAVLPEDLRHAVKELTRHLWETQRGNNSARPGFQDEPVVVGAFSSWPDRVRELVQPYNSPRVA